MTLTFIVLLGGVCVVAGWWLCLIHIGLNAVESRWSSRAEANELIDQWAGEPDSPWRREMTHRAALTALTEAPRRKEF